MIKEKILIISGPTASGKSDLASKIASKIPATIINADSMQIYRDLPILSSQPSKKEQEENEHALYSIFSHDQISSVANWLDLAKTEIKRAAQNHKLPIIVGGTGFYISSLVSGINSIPEISEEIREESRGLFEKIDKNEFIKILNELGDDEPNLTRLDKQRLIRRMEVLKQTGKSLSWWQNQEKPSNFDNNNFIHLNLAPDRETLYQNCNKRLELMLENGATEEVIDFMKLNPGDNLPAAKTIGYFEIRDYLRGFLTKEEALKRASQKTRNYAKRQLTWFRNQFREKHEITDYQNSFNQILDLIHENQ